MSKRKNTHLVMIKLLLTFLELDKQYHKKSGPGSQDLTHKEGFYFLIVEQNSINLKIWDFVFYLT
jgi:hypothetical protein